MMFFLQEAQLMSSCWQTHVRDAFRGQSRSPTKLAYGTIRYVRYCFLL